MWLITDRYTGEILCSLCRNNDLCVSRTDEDIIAILTSMVADTGVDMRAEYWEQDTDNRSPSYVLHSLPDVEDAPTVLHVSGIVVPGFKKIPHTKYLMDHFLYGLKAAKEQTDLLLATNHIKILVPRSRVPYLNQHISELRLLGIRNICVGS